VKAKGLLELVPVDQQEFLDWLGVEDGGPFRFDTDDRKQLLAAIDRARRDGSTRSRVLKHGENPSGHPSVARTAPSVIEALELAVLRYQISTRPEEARSSKRQYVSELKKLQRHARELAAAIATVGPSVKTRILFEALATQWADGVGR